jgi:hypothetical protein
MGEMFMMFVIAMSIWGVESRLRKLQDKITEIYNHSVQMKDNKQ